MEEQALVEEEEEEEAEEEEQIVRPGIRKEPLTWKLSLPGNCKEQQPKLAERLFS